MVKFSKKSSKQITNILIGASLLVPIVIIAYIAISDFDSVQFSISIPVAIAIIMYYAVLLVFGVNWLIQQIKSMLNLKNEMRKNEILYLQNQVNPHFFFNMLNNIYGTIDKDSEMAKQLILRLSDLMRYSIYNGSKQKVVLKDEVQFLQNYLYLHSIRYRKTIDVKFEIEIDEELEIVSLLLIILLENAFKHGVEKLRENAFVYMQLTTKKNRLIFEIQNNYDEKEKFNNNGIGILNLKRRLELVYPDHKLEINCSNSVHKVQLEIVL